MIKVGQIWRGNTSNYLYEIVKLTDNYVTTEVWWVDPSKNNVLGYGDLGYSASWPIVQFQQYWTLIASEPISDET